jgi:uncharacterized delta-60 repeat protein
MRWVGLVAATLGLGVLVGCGGDDEAACQGACGDAALDGEPSADGGQASDGAGSDGAGGDGATTDARSGDGGGVDALAVIPFDPGFGGGDFVTTPVREAYDEGIAAFLRPDGKLVVGGFNHANKAMFFTRIASNGAATDSAFGTGGSVLVDFGPDAATAGFAMQSDGKLLAAATYGVAGGALRRVNADGSIDASFGTSARVVLAQMLPSAIAVQSDGKILVAGSGIANPINPIVIARLTSTGAPDVTFGTGGVVTTQLGTVGSSDVAYASSIVVASDGKIVVSGYDYIASTAGTAVVRYETSGALDATFGVGGVVKSSVYPTNANTFGHPLAVMSDGRIVIGGTSSASSAAGVLARFTALGAPDTTFDTDGVVDITGAGGSAPTAIAIDASGNLFVTGIGSMIQFTSAGVQGPTTTLSFVSHGNVVAAADGTAYVPGGNSGSGVTGGVAALAHINANGTYDTAFGTTGNGRFSWNLGASADEVLGLAVQSDGKIVAAGRASADWTGGWALAR